MSEDLILKNKSRDSELGYFTAVPCCFSKEKTSIVSIALINIAEWCLSFEKVRVQQSSDDRSKFVYSAQAIQKDSGWMIVAKVAVNLVFGALIVPMVIMIISKAVNRSCHSFEKGTNVSLGVKIETGTGEAMQLTENLHGFEDDTDDEDDDDIDPEVLCEYVLPEMIGEREQANTELFDPQSYYVDQDGNPLIFVDPGKLDDYFAPVIERIRKEIRSELHKSLKIKVYNTEDELRKKYNKLIQKESYFKGVCVRLVEIDSELGERSLYKEKLVKLFEKTNKVVAQIQEEISEHLGEWITKFPESCPGWKFEDLDLDESNSSESDESIHQGEDFIDLTASSAPLKEESDDEGIGGFSSDDEIDSIEEVSTAPDPLPFNPSSFVRPGDSRRWQFFPGMSDELNSFAYRIGDQLLQDKGLQKLFSRIQNSENKTVIPSDNTSKKPSSSELNSESLQDPSLETVEPKVDAVPAETAKKPSSSELNSESLQDPSLETVEPKVDAVPAETAKKVPLAEWVSEYNRIIRDYLNTIPPVGEGMSQLQRKEITDFISFAAKGVKGKDWRSHENIEKFLAPFFELIGFRIQSITFQKNSIRADDFTIVLSRAVKIVGTNPDTGEIDLKIDVAPVIKGTISKNQIVLKNLVKVVHPISYSVDLTVDFSKDSQQRDYIEISLGMGISMLLTAYSAVAGEAVSEVKNLIFGRIYLDEVQPSLDAIAGLVQRNETVRGFIPEFVAMLDGADDSVASH